MVEDALRLLVSDEFTIEQTIEAGRVIVAKRHVPHGASILQDSSPVAHVILRPYRREVCAYCFAYDRGRDWKTRLNDAGVVFCSATCNHKWHQNVGDLGYKAHAVVESFLRRQQKWFGGSNADDSTVDVDMGGVVDLPASDVNSYDHVHQAWQDAESNGKIIIGHRTGKTHLKAAKCILRQATELPVDADSPHFLLSAVLTAYSLASNENVDANVLATSSIPSLSPLVEDVSTFESSVSLLQYIRSYTLLLAILPVELLPFVQPSLFRDLASKASYNAFSIRPSGNSDGEESGEYLGWGLWPTASVFNHSCIPNVRKERRGREWHFYADCQNGGNTVQPGEELCITYLGGDEKEMSVVERRKKLSEEWAFFCRCERCTAGGLSF